MAHHCFRHRLFAMGLLVGLLALCFSSARCATALFPLTPGTYWVYRGLTKWTTTTDVRQQTVTWKMEVTHVSHVGTMTVASLKGFPIDLAWYEPGMSRGDYLLVQTEQQVYLLQGSDRDTMLARLNAHAKVFDDLLTVGNLIISAPLTVGRRYGDAKMLARPDGYYCWVIEKQLLANLNKVNGIPAANYPLFQLAFRTNPDTQLIEFVPGIGITGYTYVHHGTVAETYLHLIEFHPGSAA
ncbi:MAG TPA: hypothetical protein VHV83_16430 [Armatimonadota bacterium]|nr:hypothetical protein [Armatimonadota bacterium]